MAAQAKENVQVIVRCRPINGKEQDEGQSTVVRVDEKSKVIEVSSKSNKPLKNFQFDCVFGPSCTQRDIYSSTITPIVDEVLNGYNCTIFAYGQTGTGKTYTMEGRRESFGDPAQAGQSAAQRWKSSRDDGIIARSVNQIFETLEKAGNEFSVRVSHLELYNEELRDLLNTSNKGLKLYEDAGNGGKVVVHSLEEKNVYTPQDIFDILQRSWEERRTAETEMNKNSSRSHCIFSITIHMKEASPEGEDLIKIGKLNLVDLAGSENIGRSGADKVQSRKQEACMINKSLLTLGRVITALTENSPHIPYRESKLTRLLQDSLGGTTKTCIIATISPASGSFEETLSTLDYAHRAKNIKNRPEINAKMSKREVLKEFTMEIHVLKAQLDAMRRKDGVYLPLDQFNQLETDKKEQAEKIQFYEDMIQQKEKELAELQEMFDRQGAQLDRTQSKLTETTDTLVKTSDQLRSTEETLEQTKESLNEHKYLLHEHQETEVKFHEEATSVIETLDNSITDLSGLFAKIDRKDNLEASNNSLLEQFREQLMGRVRSAEQTVSRFIQEESTRYANLHLSIEQFVTQKDEELQRVVERLNQLENATKNHFDSSLNRSKSFAHDSNIRLDAIQQSDSDFEQKVSTEIHGFIEDAKTIFASLQSSMQIRKDELSRWSDLRRERMSVALNEMKNYITKQTSELGAVKSRAASNTHTQVSKLESHRDALDALVFRQQEENKKMQEDLMSRIHQIVDTYFQQHQQATASAVRSITLSLQDSIKETKENNVSLSHSIDDAVHTTSRFMVSSEKVHEQALDDIENLIHQDDAFVSATCGSLTQACDKTIAFEARNLDAIQGRAAMRTTQLTATRSALQDYMAAHENHMNQASDDTVHKFEEQIRSALTQQQVASADFFQTISTEFHSGKSGVSEFAGEYTKDSTAVVGDLVSFALKQYEVTGMTPQKKEITFTRNLARTKPRDILLQEYRKQRDAGVDLDDLLSATTKNDASEATSTSTLVIDDDTASDASSSEELREAARLIESTPVGSPAHAAAPAPIVQQVQSLPPPRATSTAKVAATAAAKPAAKAAPAPVKATLPRAPSGAITKKPSAANIPTQNATAAGKKLTRAPSKTQLQEITNK